MSNQPNFNRAIIKPSRVEYIRIQVDTLLGIACPIMNFLLAANSLGRNDDNFKATAMDGGAEAAAVATFIKTCAQLDTLLEGEDYWKLQDVDNLEKSSQKMVEENIALLQTQKIASEKLISPSNRFRPQLMRLDDYVWAAVLGNLNDPKSCVCGVGPTPERAMLHFDKVFAGTVTPPVLDYALLREHMLQQNPDEALPAVFVESEEVKLSWWARFIGLFKKS